MKRTYRIERSKDGRNWERLPGEWDKAKLAFDPARLVWLDSKQFVRKNGSCTEYKCDHVRVISCDGVKAVHRFPRLRIEHDRVNQQ